MKRICFKLSLILLSCLCLTPAAFAQTEDFNTGGLFLNVAFDMYLDAEDLSAGPMLGIRGGAGWEFPLNGYSSLSLSLETGFFNIKQDENAPVPATISLLAAYAYHFNKRLSLGAGLAGGGLFAPNGNTNTVIPFIGPRVFGEWAFAHRENGSRFVSLYLGGGADINFGEENIFALPLAEVGLRFRFGKPTANQLPVSSGQIPNKIEQDEETAAEDDEEDFDSLFDLFPEASEPEQPDSPEPEIENEPAPIPSSGPKTRPQPEQLPRGNRPLVLLPDGRRGFILEEYTIYFGPNQTNISPNEETKLRRAVQLLTQFPASRFVVAGFTAWAGTEQGRNIISWERSRNVTDYLVRRGIKAGRMEVHWYGAAHPAIPNTTAANMARNRRIEFIVLEE